MNSVYLSGSDELGAVRKTYLFGLNILIEDVLIVFIGIYFLIRGLQLSEDYSYRIMSALGDRTAVTLIILGVAFSLFAALDFRTRKEIRLEVCEKGVRGKGSTGWFGYKLQTFQLSYDEIVKVENKKLGPIPGVCISTKDAEICARIRDGEAAMRQITDLASAWNAAKSQP